MKYATFCETTVCGIEHACALETLLLKQVRFQENTLAVSQRQSQLVAKARRVFTACAQAQRAVGWQFRSISLWHFFQRNQTGFERRQLLGQIYANVHVVFAFVNFSVKTVTVVCQRF